MKLKVFILMLMAFFGMVLSQSYGEAGHGGSLSTGIKGAEKGGLQGSAAIYAQREQTPDSPKPSSDSSTSSKQ
ncbi:hypothetical protein NQ315_011955 [Exocentrus adspersus]|uniref:Uncharacterized protein n=1 Tax=Exocentrus adspersus TaxID=1586481 RepID=A0AAV8W1U2_9CUCU|nr:hypothetical protein NQ315_011955 [Exocentrus adspersus]